MKTKLRNNKDKFFTKLTLKNGISLITLVITIVVVIILAAAVVMSLNNNNVLTNASSAKYTTDLDTMQSYLELATQKISLKHQGTIQLDTGEISMEATSNVKDTKGTITWESTDIGNLSGELIFDEGTDTDTTFYTGYKLPIYGSETKWYVDENGKLVLQTGSRIYGADEVPTKTINARKILNNPQKYYGAYVNYTPTNTLSEDYKWRIFYATNDNIFLISADYINVDDLPTTANGNKPMNVDASYSRSAPFNNILNDYSGCSDITEDMKWFNKDYFDKGFTSTNTNMKAVAYMLDKNIWTEKFNGKEVDYVIGGPSLEIILNSYNQFTNQNNMYQARAKNSIGYEMSDDGGISWNYTSISSSKYLIQGSGLYRISSQSNASAYWISSPSATTSNYVIDVYCGGNINYNDYGNPDKAFRPLICLQSGIHLKEIEEGKTYDI